MTYLDQNNVGAGLSETDGDGLANASGAARDDGGLALEGEERRRHRKGEGKLVKSVSGSEVLSRRKSLAMEGLEGYWVN